MKKEESFSTNLTKLAVLFALKPEAHGYKLMKHLEVALNKNISAGQIYPLLHKMNADGLITSRDEFLGVRKKIIYIITPKGIDLKKQIKLSWTKIMQD